MRIGAQGSRLPFRGRLWGWPVVGAGSKVSWPRGQAAMAEWAMGFHHHLHPSAPFLASCSTLITDYTRRNKCHIKIGANLSLQKPQMFGYKIN